MALKHCLNGVLMLFLLYLNTHFVFQDLFGIVLNTTLAYHLSEKHLSPK